MVIYNKKATVLKLNCPFDVAVCEAYKKYLTVYFVLAKACHVHLSPTCHGMERKEILQIAYRNRNYQTAGSNTITFVSSGPKLNMSIDRLRCYNKSSIHFDINMLFIKSLPKIFLVNFLYISDYENKEQHS